MKRKQIFSLTAMLACGTAGAWFGHTVFHRDADAAMNEPAQMESGDSADEPVANQQVATPGTDQSAEILLKESNRGEALAWLQDTSSPRGVARWSKDEALGLFHDFYMAGATKIYVVDTDTVAQTQVASQFVVVLPTDASARKAVFDCEAKFQARYDEEPTPDKGQKYLQITTD